MNTLQEFYDRFFSTDIGDTAFNKFIIICNVIHSWLFLPDYSGSIILDYLFTNLLSIVGCKGMTNDEYSICYEAYSFLRTQDTPTVRYIVRAAANYYQDLLDRKY